jgi:hypothetical protein
MESSQINNDARAQKARDYGAELQQQIAEKKAAQERENAQRRGIVSYQFFNIEIF